MTTKRNSLRHIPIYCPRRAGLTLKSMRRSSARLCNFGLEIDDQTRCDTIRSSQECRSVLEHVQKTLRAVRRARAGARAGARTAGQGAAREEGARAVRPCDRRVHWAPSVRGGSAVELEPILRRNKYGSGQWNTPKPVRTKRRACLMYRYGGRYPKRGGGWLTSSAS